MTDRETTRLRTLVRLRAFDLEEARREMGLRIAAGIRADAAAARARLALVEEARVGEGFSAWLPRGRADLAQAERVAGEAEAEIRVARERLVGPLAALKAAEGRLAGVLGVESRREGRRVQARLEEGRPGALPPCLKAGTPSKPGL